MIDKVLSSFKKEFHPIEDKFIIINLSINEAYESKDQIIVGPGVYVFWFEDKIIKVGRHLTNSRKRALEHIRDNTRNDAFQMNSFKDCNTQCGLILINCNDPEDYHWIAAIEIRMEDVLNPVIKSGRKG